MTSEHNADIVWHCTDECDHAAGRYMCEIHTHKVDLCTILGHDPHWDEPNHCGRCDARIDGADDA